MSSDDDNSAVASTILKRVEEAATEASDGPLRLGDIIARFGDASFVPAMLVPAIIVFSPLSGIPFLSSTMGLTIALVAAQMVYGRHHLWLPRRLQRIRIKRQWLRRGVARLKPAAGWVDRRLRPRWTVITAAPMDRILPILCMCCGMAMPFLELVPFSSSILGAAVICFGSGLLSRDGLLVLLGCGFMGLATLVPLGAYALYGQAMALGF